LVRAFLDAVNIITTASANVGGSFEWQFARAQADTAEMALRTAENALRDFHVANRNIGSSPALLTEEARLQWHVQMRRQVYVSLVQQAEVAKLEAVRNTPATVLIQAPQASIKAASPKPAVWGAFVSITVLILVGGWVYVLGSAMLPHLPASVTKRLPRSLSPVA
jgi:uncharacterized protein involved in exopolysaccharide biosynthesis